MAKRKRLTPPRDGYLASSQTPSQAAPARASMTPAPIAQVAGDAATAAAFHDVAETLARAREEGRLVLSLPLDTIEADHLLRDRLLSDTDDMATLVDSLRARGQQTPVEVVALGGARYGLVSGWRRLRALRQLHQETGEDRFGQIQALLRAPDTQAEAYIAMVEENEIRADLSFYERARIVRRAVAAGVFADDQTALGALFATAPPARRSKIKAFLRVVDGLDDVLRHPTRLAEHLGLKLAKALAQDTTLPDRLRAALAHVDPADASAETAALQATLSHAKPASPKAAPQPQFQRVIDGVAMRSDRGRIELQGRRLTPNFTARLEAWLKSLDSH